MNYKSTRITGDNLLLQNKYFAHTLELQKIHNLNSKYPFYMNNIHLWEDILVHDTFKLITILY
jgi:hypothetical protein